MFGTYVRERPPKPLALVWENLQWIDASSLTSARVLRLRVTNGGSVLMLLVFRPNEGRIGELHQKLLRTYGADYRVIELAPLGARLFCATVSRFCERHVPGHTMPLELRERIFERAEGNPFFLEEMLRALVDRGPGADQQK